jgi:hypothetical protein
MPYFTFHNMAPADADAIAAFILSLPAKGTQQPARQPLPAPLQPSFFPIQPTALSAIPDPAPGPNHDQAMMGKYLAAQLGVCMECHTKHLPTGGLDTTRLFAGGEAFGAPFNDESLNITPATNGIKTWTPQQVQTLILTGKDDQGMPICPPMPAGPFGSFGGMTPEHALDIGYFVTSIPGIENPTDGGAFHMCVGALPPDGGTMPDSGMMTDAGKKADGAP